MDKSIADMTTEEQVEYVNSTLRRMLNGETTAEEVSEGNQRFLTRVTEAILENRKEAKACGASLSPCMVTVQYQLDEKLGVLRLHRLTEATDMILPTPLRRLTTTFTVR